MDRVTKNIRHPITNIVPRNGQRIVLQDGRRGYVAGHALTAGKLTFVDIDARASVDLWPTQFQGFMEVRQ